MKPRLNPSRTVDITRLSAPVGASLNWSRTAAKISALVAAANPSTVKLITNASHISVVNASDPPDQAHDCADPEQCELVA